MTTANIAELWAGLRQATQADVAGDFRMRLCHTGRDVRVFAAVCSSGREPALIIEIPTSVRPQRLGGVSGRRINVMTAELPGLPSGRAAVVIHLKDPDFEDLFVKLGDDLIAEIRGALGGADAVNRIVKVIGRWRRFLDQHRDVLSPEETRGLIGELAVLERLARRIGAAAALAAWKAPRGSIRDFECDDRTIEVKTFTASAGATVRISDPLQLEPDPGVPLLLACQELGRSQLAEHALPSHVARVAALFAHDTTLAEDFQDALASAGYLAAHADLYTDGYALGTLHAFRVGEDFPRIRPDSVPSEVINVQFSIQVLCLSPFGANANSEVGTLP
jgi:hypothetical protein